jgi:hypothetical protein
MEPGRGRFWSQDEYEGDDSDPGSLHKFLYCGNNPMNARDPSGQFTLAETAVSVGLVSMGALLANSATARLEKEVWLDPPLSPRCK